MLTVNPDLLLRELDDAIAALSAEQTDPAPSYKAIKKPERKVFPILYLPVEVKARELHSKAIIAREAKRLGFTVFLGATWIFSEWIPYLPPGVALLKSMNATDANNIVKWTRAGTLTAVLDEEAFGIAPTPHYLKGTVHPYVPMFADLICAQGTTYREAFPYPGNIVVTGNPRVLTYESARGEDILVCLQSGNINNNGPSVPEMMRATLKLAPGPVHSEAGRAWADIFRSSLIHEARWLPLVTETISALATAFPGRTIRVRPHPVEKLSVWRFSEPNVVVDAEGSIADAMRRSSVLVYVSGCTTGLDAVLAKMPAVRLGEGGHGISASLHPRALTASEAVAAVRRQELWQGDLSAHFGPVDLVRHLHQLHACNPAGGEAHIRASIQMKVKDFHLRKFPETSAEEIAALVGAPAVPVAWNTWRI
jgi:surface carbohydrate biosynthesis protein